MDRAPLDREPPGSQEEGEPGGSRSRNAPEGARSSVRVIKRSIVIAGHRTSVSLEDAFWHALKDIAAQEDVSLAALVARIDASRGEANLSSALRVFALERALAKFASRESDFAR